MTIVAVEDPEAVALRATLGELGPFAGEALVAVDLRAGVDAATTAALRAAPAVVVGVLEAGGGGAAAVDDQPIVEAASAVDVVLVVGPTPAAPRARGVEVVVDDLDTALLGLLDGVAAAPAAAVSLVQLLRAGEAMDLAAAVVAESWVYSMLQSGPLHRAWLAERPPRRTRPDPAQVATVHREGARVDVVLRRPHVRNAVSARLRDELHESLAVPLSDPTVTDVHLWGEGPVFSSGGDLVEFGSAPDPATAHVARTTRSPALDLARCAPRLTAHVQGASVGAGVEWAAFARRVVARHDATFRLPEVAMGLVPGAGGTASIPRRIGRHRTAHLALTGATLDAATALGWGLVDEVVSDEAFGGPPA